MALLCVAARCERRHMPDGPPITDIEVQGAFLLALPQGLRISLFEKQG